MNTPKLTARELAEQLAEERALITVRRDDDRIRRQLDAQYRNALAEVTEQTSTLDRARRERARDGEESTALAELYRRAARSGARARIRTDIDRSAEMRALRIARVRSATLLAGVPVLAAFGLWSTAGVQAGMVRVFSLDTGSASWTAAWAVEPALIAIVALIIIGRAVLRSSGGATDWRATLAEWVALSTSVALNMAGGWAGDGWEAAAGALAHSVGPIGAAGTAFLIGLFVSYVSEANPWEGAPRLAELDLTPPPAAEPMAAEVSVARPGEMTDRERELVEDALAQARTAGPRLRALMATERAYLDPPLTRHGDDLEALVVATSVPATPAAINPPSPRQPDPPPDAIVAAPEPDIRPATVAATAPATRITRRVATRPATTAERVAALAKQPDMTQKKAAAKLRVSERTVQRYWPKPASQNSKD
ncbi:hypothetical protein O7602_26585 [Micromonospora sp. WMMD1128]|uniref:hypothetical protein n=1 Tax=Micromonospora sp. WMMD1128 TaxID=3015150 RepID=UPI00248C04AA|nr:hypothetical protein [Micromonospora sp. WMMD1128]WBB73211.1 hypothetical protein O7602_26585 [Micromonospora sp. WMMD1128]